MRRLWPSVEVGMVAGGVLPSRDPHHGVEVEAGLAFLRQTGSEHIGQILDSHQWLAGVLPGESSAVAGSVAALSDRYAGQPAGASFRACRACGLGGHLWRSCGAGTTYGAGHPAAGSGALQLPDRRDPAAARAGSGRAGPRHR